MLRQLGATSPQRAHGVVWVLGSVVLCAAAPRPGDAACTLGRLAELPVTMVGMRPIVHAKINGVDAPFIADSGAFYSSLTPAAAREFGLTLLHSPIQLQGVGGAANTWLTSVKVFTLFNLPIPNVDFFVVGSDMGGGAVGLLGQNVFRIADVEYDLANGVIRLLRPENCKRAELAYWANDGSKPYSVIDIRFADRAHPHTVSEAYVNGVKISVMFDTGAATSLLTLAAAKRAGVTPDSPAVTRAGVGSGIGRRTYADYVGPFTSFKIGDEEIRNTRLRFGDASWIGADMLIGADFFLAHRILVASSQAKLYFSYNGGPVFNLAHDAAPAVGDSGSAATPATGSIAPDGAARAQDAPQPSSGQPPPAGQTGDAEAFARRGAASAARHEYGQAITELTRACELDPTQARYHYQRGVAYLESHQTDLALADLDKAILLDPNEPMARITRSSVRLWQHDPPPEIAADLDAADRTLPKEHEARLTLAGLYEATDNLPAAIAQFTLWINSHERDDTRAAGALNGRCRTRALLGQELQQALADCNAALKGYPHSAAFHDSRALVYLRLNEYDQAITDYDAALAARPRSAWSLYGRGVARLKLQQTEKGQADIAAAEAIDAAIAAHATKHGIGP